MERQVGALEGAGNFNVDFLVYHWLGFDLANASKATLETLRLPTRVLMPFLVLVVVSYFTPRNRAEVLDRYYAKMKTEVERDPEADRRALEESYRNPARFEGQRLLPGTDFEMLRPRPKDVLGFLAAVAACFLIIGLLVWLAGIGA
ncbi:MAG: hypothetical protein GWO24_21725 [Akkermansiaceae bacterium]|nr:hypothetical protein [Akkermansiaceae bacterium]